jgi:hypothetical protein
MSLGYTLFGSPTTTLHFHLPNSEIVLFGGGTVLNFYPNSRKYLLALKNGSTIKVWTDTSHDQQLHHSLPHLASFAKTLETSVQQALLLEDLSDLFHLPLTEAAYLEYITLSDLLQSFDSVDESDIWSYPWGVNYSVSKAYAFFMNLKYPSPLHPTFSWLWKSCYQQNTESSADCSSKTD